MLAFPRVGPGWPDAAAAGGANWSPSSLGSCWTCCPPLHFRAAGEGDRAAFLSSLFPSHLSGRQKSQRPERRGKRTEA